MSKKGILSAHFLFYNEYRLRRCGHACAPTTSEMVHVTVSTVSAVLTILLSIQRRTQSPPAMTGRITNRYPALWYYNTISPMATIRGTSAIQGMNINYTRRVFS